MSIKFSKLPLMIKKDFNVATEYFVIWTGMFQIGKYLPLLRKSKVIHGYIIDGKKKVWFCRYGFVNDKSIYK